MKVKKAMVVLAAALAGLGLTACGGGAKSTADGLEGKNISIMTPYLSSVTTNQMVENLQAGLEKEGAEVTVIDTANDFSKLASRIEDVVTAQTDGIILVSADPSQLENQLQEAFDANIPVFGCDSGFIEGMQVNATSDNYQMGQLITDYLFNDLMGGEGNVIALTHRPHPGVVKRCEAFDDAIAANDKISLITEQHIPAEQPINDAQDTVENLLLSNPEKGSITAIWCGWDEPAIGATQACMEAGRDEILVVGLIKQGTNLKATVKQNFDGMADIVLEQMKLLYTGKEIEKGDMYADATLITQENAE